MKKIIRVFPTRTHATPTDELARIRVLPGFFDEADPFNGSGTTRIVANKLGRNAIGFELNPEYIEIEEKRRNKELGIFNI